MRDRILIAASAVALVTVMGASCGANISVNEDGNVSIGDGASGLEISGDQGSPGSAGGGTVVTDELVNIANDGGSVTQDCGGRDVNVAASGSTVTLNGGCGLVTVVGSGNQVHVGSASRVNLLGADNTVYYASGDPSTTDLGSGNSIEPGGNAAP